MANVTRNFTTNSGSPYHEIYDESEPLLPSTPPPSYYNVFSKVNNCGIDIPPPTYQQSNRPKNRYLGPPTSQVGRPNDHKTLAAAAYFCCLLLPSSWIALYYSARVQEHINDGDMQRAKKASRQTCFWSACTLIFGWTFILLLVAMATIIVTCYELHETCGILLIKNFTHTKV